MGSTDDTKRDEKISNDTMLHEAIDTLNNPALHIVLDRVGPAPMADILEQLLFRSVKDGYDRPAASLFCAMVRIQAFLVDLLPLADNDPPRASVAMRHVMDWTLALLDKLPKDDGYGDPAVPVLRGAILGKLLVYCVHVEDMEERQRVFTRILECKPLNKREQDDWYSGVREALNHGEATIRQLAPLVLLLSSISDGDKVRFDRSWCTGIEQLLCHAIVRTATHGQRYIMIQRFSELLEETRIEPKE